MGSSVAPDSVFKSKGEGHVVSLEIVIMIAIDFLSNNFRKHGRRPKAMLIRLEQALVEIRIGLSGLLNVDSFSLECSHLSCRSVNTFDAS